MFVKQLGFLSKPTVKYYFVSVRFDSGNTFDI
jgi:hypothetical protein